jgi:hypothetical protein
MTLLYTNNREQDLVSMLAAEVSICHVNLNVIIGPPRNKQLHQNDGRLRLQEKQGGYPLHQPR